MRVRTAAAGPGAYGSRGVETLMVLWLRCQRLTETQCTIRSNFGETFLPLLAGVSTSNQELWQ